MVVLRDQSPARGRLDRRKQASRPIVDVEQAILRAYTRILSSNGYSVSTAPSGELALEVFAREAIDVIVTDLTMPGMTCRSSS